METVPILPAPATIKISPGSLKIKGKIRISAPKKIKKVTGVFEEFVQKTGLVISKEKQSLEINLRTTRNNRLKQLGNEAYLLKVTKDKIYIQAFHPHGFFNALMSCLQLLKSKDIPCLEIIDYPRFSHRGLLLDPARNFLGLDCLREVLDLMAKLKMTVLHFHLSDDQGWRFESKTFPLLHQVGGQKGYYTQKELKDLVAYADQRFITIIPEIDLPGHCSALLAAYPNLSCGEKSVKLPRLPGIYSNIICPFKEEVYCFLEKLLDEVVSVFPAPTIHTGGDEVFPKDWGPRKNRQKHLANFTQRLNSILRRFGKSMTVWDEAIKYSSKDVTVQIWRSPKLAQAATERKNSIIISPVNPWYLNYPNFFWKLKKAYLFEPTEGLNPLEAKLVIGGEGCLWGEFVPELKVIPKLFPRLLAIAEVLWSPKEKRNWTDFKVRATKMNEQLQKEKTACPKRYN
jgi:hexosaminidase